jgi:hypothetical protein
MNIASTRRVEFEKCECRYETLSMITSNVSKVNLLLDISCQKMSSDRKRSACIAANSGSKASSSVIRYLFSAKKRKTSSQGIEVYGFFNNHDDYSHPLEIPML